MDYRQEELAAIVNKDEEKLLREKLQFILEGQFQECQARIQVILNEYGFALTTEFPIHINGKEVAVTLVKMKE